MSAGQRSGTGAMDELNDEDVRKNDILSNREKSQRQPGQGLDNKGMQVDEYKDIPSNRRPSGTDAAPENEKTATKVEEGKPAGEADEPDPTDAAQQVDRPGFDLGGSTGKTQAGRGLGLGADAKDDRKGQRLPR